MFLMMEAEVELRSSTGLPELSGEAEKKEAQTKLNKLTETIEKNRKKEHAPAQRYTSESRCHSAKKISLVCRGFAGTPHKTKALRVARLDRPRPWTGGARRFRWRTRDFFNTLRCADATGLVGCTELMSVRVCR